MMLRSRNATGLAVRHSLHASSVSSVFVLHGMHVCKGAHSTAKFSPHPPTQPKIKLSHTAHVPPQAASPPQHKSEQKTVFG